MKYVHASFFPPVGSPFCALLSDYGVLSDRCQPTISHANVLFLNFKFHPSLGSGGMRHAQFFPLVQVASRRSQMGSHGSSHHTRATRVASVVHMKVTSSSLLPIEPSTTAREKPHSNIHGNQAALDVKVPSSNNACGRQTPSLRIRYPPIDICVPMCNGDYPDGRTNHCKVSLSGTTHTPNQIIASQGTCSTTITLHDHEAFGHLRAGHKLQWRNMLKEHVHMPYRYGQDPSTSSFSMLRLATCGQHASGQTPHDHGG